ncbi:MAG: PilZ domain-containing protein, partial [Myxococcota bacterium]
SSRCRVIRTAMKSTDERRDHERIDIQMKTRLWLDETVRGKHMQFEGYAETRDLAIGGTFVHSDYLLPMGSPINMEMLMDDVETLSARGEIVHILSDETRGMGILFTEVDAENRERLLRFFVSERVQEFYRERFVVEFPHLADSMTLKDVALVINLWEDKEGRLTALRRPEGAEARNQRRMEEVAASKRRSQVVKTTAKVRART